MFEMMQCIGFMAHTLGLKIAIFLQVGTMPGRIIYYNLFQELC